MWIPVWRTWVSSIKLSYQISLRKSIAFRYISLLLLHVCAFSECAVCNKVQTLCTACCLQLPLSYILLFSLFFLSTLPKNVRLTDVLEAALPPMLQTCISALCPAIPIWPNCRKWISSEAAFCLSVSDKSILNSISPHSRSIPLGEEDHFYVTASWRAEGLGPAFLVCVCCFSPAPLLQKSNVAKALINTFREPREGLLVKMSTSLFAPTEWQKVFSFPFSSFYLGF